jgi:hypothetical protein
MNALEYAKEMLAHDAVVFFEVWVDDDEDIFAAAREISDLGCSTVIDNTRHVIKVFSTHEMPKGFGFL